MATNGPVEFLGRTAEWWDGGLIISVVIAALAAISIGVTTAGSVLAHKREAKAAEEALERYQLDTRAKIAEANAKAEKEKLERVKLQAEIAPRRLSSDQRGRIASKLRNMPAPPTIGIVSRLLDTEGSDFANDLADAIKDGGWHVVRIGNWTAPEKGLLIATVERSEVDDHSEAIVALEQALESADQKPAPFLIKNNRTREVSPYFVLNAVYILVGAKP